MENFYAKPKFDKQYGFFYKHLKFKC